MYKDKGVHLLLAIKCSSLLKRANFKAYCTIFILVRITFFKTPKESALISTCAHLIPNIFLVFQGDLEELKKPQTGGVYGMTEGIISQRA